VKNNKMQQLAEQWNRAIERAAEEQPRDQELGEEELKQAASLKIWSNLNAGQGSLYATCAAYSVARTCRYGAEG